MEILIEGGGAFLHGLTRGLLRRIMKYKADENENTGFWDRPRRSKCERCLNRVECETEKVLPMVAAGPIDGLLKMIAKALVSACEDLRLAVHPFTVTGGLYLMNNKGDYGTDTPKPELFQWQKELADTLWDVIPGLLTLFFSNGEIHIRHSGCFSNKELESVALSVIKPFLSRELRERKEAIKKGDWDWNKK